MIHRFSQVNDKANDIAAGQKQPSFRSDVSQENPLIQLHDPDSPDMAYAARVAKEIIRISGAHVIVYTRTHNNDVDDVWEEDANPTYRAGKHYKAFFVPEPIKTELTRFGSDTENNVEIVFDREQIYQDFGDRMLHAGDIIEVPYNSAFHRLGKFRILNARDSGNFRYKFLYFTCECQNITDDITINIDHQ